MKFIGQTITVLLFLFCTPFIAFGRDKLGSNVVLCALIATAMHYLLIQTLFIGFAYTFMFGRFLPDFAMQRFSTYADDVLFWIYLSSFCLLIGHYLFSRQNNYHPASFGNTLNLFGKDDYTGVPSVYTLERVLFLGTFAAGFFLVNEEMPEYAILIFFAVFAVVPRIILQIFISSETGNIVLLGNPKVKPPTYNKAGVAVSSHGNAGGVKAIISRRAKSIQRLERD